MRADATVTPLDRLTAEAVQHDPFARLFERRILFLRGPIEDTRADELVAQLLALDAESADPITLYIDSPGGVLTGMFAVYDAVRLVRAPVATTCVGFAASAAAILLATGTGPRSATPNARIMLHQPHGGAQGTAADIQIQAAQIALLRTRAETILADRTGQSIEKIHADTQRDFHLSADEALAYGLIDEVAR